MKKMMLILMFILTVLTLSSCQNEKEMFSISYFDYMYTYIGIDMYVTEGEFTAYEKDINDIFEMYHDLTTSYDPLPESSPLKHNVYDVNQQKNTKLEIDQELYEVLSLAIDYQTLTEGYFDMTLGTPVRLWKSLIENTPDTLSVGGHIFIHSYSNEPVMASGVIESLNDDEIQVLIHGDIITYTLDDLTYEFEVSDTSYQKTLSQVESLSQAQANVLLETKDGLYYVTFEAEDETIDLGAFTKGYATNLVKTYLIEKGVTYFSITAGSSSISVGKNINRPNENEVFIVSLTDPMYSSQPFRSYYGLIHIKDTSVATSGNFEQYTLYKGERYHHIISPFTYMPVNEYYALTITGPDAGLLDVLSTALFVMDNDTLEAFLNEHQERLGIEVIAYAYDGMVYEYTTNLYFEDKRS